MSIIKWEPFNEIDNFFEDFAVPSLSKIGSDLAIDLYEENGDIIAKMNIPGVDPEKIKVSVEDNILRVTGTHEEEKSEKKKNYYHKEIKKGSFERVMSLPQPVKVGEISAEYKQGVLKIKLPKERSEQSIRKVQIHVKK